jgi:hypothetical protein
MEKNNAIQDSPIAKVVLKPPVIAGHCHTFAGDDLHVDRPTAGSLEVGDAKDGSGRARADINRFEKRRPPYQ